MAMKNGISYIIVICIISLCAFCSTSSHPEKEGLTITVSTLPDNAKIGLECLIRGNISASPRGNLYVLIHPLNTGLWFLQRRPSVINPDGSWQTLCFLGTKTKGVGEKFEVIAIVTGKTLKQSETIEIGNLPRDAVKSKTITITRTK